MKLFLFTLIVNTIFSTAVMAHAQSGVAHTGGTLRIIECYDTDDNKLNLQQSRGGKLISNFNGKTYLKTKELFDLDSNFDYAFEFYDSLDAEIPTASLLIFSERDQSNGLNRAIRTVPTGGRPEATEYFCYVP